VLELVLLESMGTDAVLVTNLLDRGLAAALPPEFLEDVLIETVRE
jgi:hypothetical protein